MSSVPYESFLPEVLPFVRDAPEFVVVNAIRNACMEFCRESQYWREQLDSITVVPDQAEYDLSSQSSGAGIASIVTARIGRQLLLPKATEELDLMLGPDWRTLQGVVGYITHDSEDTVRLVQVPAQLYTDTLEITAALVPFRSSVKVGKCIYERYAEVIAFGARARLHDTPGQPYTDEAAAKKFRMWFESGYGDARIAANKGLGRTPLVVRPPSII